MPLSMDNRNRMVCLFDCYGALLTEKQRLLFQYYFDEDLSLAEISDLVGISRQAVHNSISRCEESLELFEDALGVLARDREVDACLAESIDAIERGLASEEWNRTEFEKILAHLKRIRKAG